jgi:hypothetical protein
LTTNLKPAGETLKQNSIYVGSVVSEKATHVGSVLSENGAKLKEKIQSQEFGKKIMTMFKKSDTKHNMDDAATEEEKKDHQ